jgi:hypothetical protein
MPHATWSRTMTERCTLDGFVITPIEDSVANHRKQES